MLSQAALVMELGMAVIGAIGAFLGQVAEAVGNNGRFGV